MVYPLKDRKYARPMSERNLSQYWPRWHICPHLSAPAVQSILLYVYCRAGSWLDFPDSYCLAREACTLWCALATATRPGRFHCWQLLAVDICNTSHSFHPRSELISSFWRFCARSRLRLRRRFSYNTTKLIIMYGRSRVTMDLRLPVTPR